MSNDIINITVSGVAGIGKSTLAKHLAAILSQQGFRVKYRDPFFYPISDVHKLIENGPIIDINEVSLNKGLPSELFDTSSFTVKRNASQDGANIPETHIHSNVEKCIIGTDAYEQVFDMTEGEWNAVQDKIAEDMKLSFPTNPSHDQQTVAVGFGCLMGDGQYVTGSVPPQLTQVYNDGLSPFAPIRQARSENGSEQPEPSPNRHRLDEIIQRFRDIPEADLNAITSQTAREMANKVTLESLVKSVLMEIHDRAEDGHLELKYKLKYIPKLWRQLVILTLRDRGFNVSTNFKCTKIKITYETA